MSRFDIVATGLRDLHVLRRKPLADSRGYLERMFCERDLADVTAGRRIVQINHTLTRDRGAVRGMHFQLPPHAEMKLVSCMRGRVFDVVVDLRHGSPTFLQWHGEELSAESGRTLCIPEGFAHGFQTLTDDCEMLYLHTAAYEAAAERGVSPVDPRVAIRWPLPIAQLSERDAGHAPLADDYAGIRLP